MKMEIWKTRLKSSWVITFIKKKYFCKRRDRGSVHCLYPTEASLAALCKKPAHLRSNVQARSQDRIWGGAEPPQKWTFWTPKFDFLNLTPFNPPTKTPFLVHFVTKSGPFARWVGSHPSPPWLWAWMYGVITTLGNTCYGSRSCLLLATAIACKPAHTSS